MKNLPFIVLFTAISLPLFAEEEVKPTYFPAPSPLVFEFDVEEMVKPTIEISDLAAHVRVLNKRTNDIDDYKLTRQTIVQHGGLEVVALNCVENYSEQRDSDVAWVELTNVENHKKVFSGWVYSKFPSMSGLEHPVYDIRLLGCTKN